MGNDIDGWLTEKIYFIIDEETNNKKMIKVSPSVLNVRL